MELHSCDYNLSAKDIKNISEKYKEGKKRKKRKTYWIISRIAGKVFIPLLK